MDASYFFLMNFANKVYIFFFPLILHFNKIHSGSNEHDPQLGLTLIVSSKAIKNSSLQTAQSFQVIHATKRCTV